MTDRHNLRNKDRVEQFKILCDNSCNLFEYKNTQYGDAIVETGVLGAVVELVGSVARLKTMVLQNPIYPENVDISKLRDIFMDIHNYANIALLMLNDENYRGAE